MREKESEQQSKEPCDLYSMNGHATKPYIRNSEKKWTFLLSYVPQTWIRYMEKMKSSCHRNKIPPSKQEATFRFPVYLTIPI